VLFAAILVRVVTDPSHAPFRRLLDHGPAASFGKYSYAIYLLHSPIRDGYLAIGWDPRTAAVFGSQLPGQFAFYTVVIATTFAAALASWHLFEKHFLRLKQLFPADARGPLERRGASPAPARWGLGRFISTAQVTVLPQ
jgi:peptidoglycan/LPS O-acetylase OafA/YrhL